MRPLPGSSHGSVSDSRPFPACFGKERGDAHGIDAARTVPSVRAAADLRLVRKMIRRKAAYGCGSCRQEMGKYGRKKGFDPFV